MATSDVQVVVHHAEIAKLGSSLEMRDALLEAVAPAVHEARARAPQRTGSGAASIRAEPVLDGPLWEVHASWEQLRFYMRFHETGTVQLPARPFLVPSFVEGVTE